MAGDTLINMSINGTPQPEPEPVPKPGQAVQVSYRNEDINAVISIYVNANGTDCVGAGV